MKLSKRGSPTSSKLLVPVCSSPRHRAPLHALRTAAAVVTPQQWRVTPHIHPRPTATSGSRECAGKKDNKEKEEEDANDEEICPPDPNVAKGYFKLKKTRERFQMFPVLFILLLVNLYSTSATDANDANDASLSTSHSTAIRPIPKLRHEPPEHNSGLQQPVRGEDNIFFLETSCIQQSSARELNPRQACAIESAARHNPSHKIYLLYLCDMATLPQHVRQLLLQYENVLFWKLNASLFVAGTPLEKWWKDEGLRSSDRYPVTQASDVLRLVALWKYGGTYMDLDVVVLNNVP